MAKSSRLAEGVDFYVEDGKVVFTSYYLLRRGYCCNKGCRHCPYKDEISVRPGTIQIKSSDGVVIGGAAGGGSGSLSDLTAMGGAARRRPPDDD